MGQAKANEAAQKDAMVLEKKYLTLLEQAADASA